MSDGAGLAGEGGYDNLQGRKSTWLSVDARKLVL